MKKEKVLRSERVVICITSEQKKALDKAVVKSKLPRGDALRNFLLSAT